MSRSRTITRILIAAALAAPLAGAHAQQPLEVPLATWGSPTHINITEFLGPLEDSLYRQTGGRITVQHFPGGQIAQGTDMPIALPSGRVRMGWITIPTFSGLVPDVRINDAPFGLSLAQSHRAMDMPGGFKEVLGAQFEARGIKLLAMNDLGPAAIVSNRKLESPADFEGLRVRVYSEGGARLMQALGAAPVNMPFADVYPAMQRGTIDASLIGFQGILSQRMYEVSKFTLVPASFLGMTLQGYAANLDWWNGLDAADREILTAAIREAELICRYMIVRDRTSIASQLEELGMEVTILDSGSEAFPAWQEAVSPFLDSAEQELSAEILAPARQVLAEAM